MHHQIARNERLRLNADVPPGNLRRSVAAATAVAVTTAATTLFLFLKCLDRGAMMMVTMTAAAATGHFLDRRGRRLFLMVTVTTPAATVTVTTAATALFFIPEGLGRLNLTFLSFRLGAKTEEFEHRMHPFKGK